ncbi:MAG: undecaprenyl-diphosphatase UppP [Bacteriovoracia bacterium]
MDTLQAIILGVVQGLTEFLPISSSAHLVLFPKLLHWKDPGLAFDVALHMGTLVAILFYFRKDWVSMFPTSLSLKKVDKTLIYLIIATIPAAILGFAFESVVEEYFRSSILIAFSLMIFGALLLYADNPFRKQKKYSTIELRSALLIGLAQSLAIIPGVSRSGITITAALLLGLRRADAVRFSFLLSAPIIAGAGILKSKELFNVLSQGGQLAESVALGFLASLVFGFFAIWMLNKIIKTRTFLVFGVYRILFGLLLIFLAVQNKI